MIKFLIFSLVAAVSADTDKIHPKLLQRFLIGGGGNSGEEKQNVMVSFNQDIQSVIDRINSQSFPDINAKRVALIESEESFTQAAQQPLQNILNNMGVQYSSFWINNKMIVQNASSSLVNTIARAPGVERVEPEPVAEMNRLPGIDIPEWATNGTNTTAEWGIRRIGADIVWAANYTGNGVVVGGIDSGVRASHVAIRSNWRSEMGWFDGVLPINKKPIDYNGHGTHTMATIVGQNGIGVAPGAKWIACAGCNPLNCRAEGLFMCAQFMACPNKMQWGSNPFSKNCSGAPDIVSNSWGGGEDDKTYDSMINTWRAAGIIPVFALGNDGPLCSSGKSPGDRPGVISVGSMDQNNRISDFSSRGPSNRRNPKESRMIPTIVAPGGKVRSAWHLTDTSYNTISGTSMSCPHISGVIALMKERNPKLTYDMAEKAIIKTADKSVFDMSKTSPCGGVANDVFPNNVFGNGMVDAVLAVNEVAPSQ